MPTTYATSVQATIPTIDQTAIELAASLKITHLASNPIGQIAINRAGTRTNGEGNGDHAIACTQAPTADKTTAGQTSGALMPPGLNTVVANRTHSPAWIAVPYNIGQPTNARVRTGSTSMCEGNTEPFDPKSVGL